MTTADAPRRVLVLGTSGSGKTTLARALARHLGVPHHELDAIHHLPDWQPIATDDFRARVEALTAADGWVVDGNYSAARDIVLARADTVVMLDLPRHRIMRQIIGRTLRRLVTREELWNGNREQVRNLLSTDPDRNILLWAWTTHARRRQEMYDLEREAPGTGLRVVRLRTPAQVAAVAAGGVADG